MEKVFELRMARRKCIDSGFFGRQNRRTLNVCGRLYRLIEIDLPRKAYCSVCTVTASYGTYMVSYGTDTVIYSTSTVSYGSSGKKGLPGLCAVLPSASNVGVLCCNATRTVLSILPHTLYCIRTTFSELPQALCLC